MNLIGLTGSAGAGKSTVADILVREHGFVAVSLADEMKRICANVFGFTEEQLWGPSALRNEPDPRFYRGIPRFTYPDAPEGSVWVPLTVPREYTLIDREDFDRVSQVKWTLHRKEIGRNTDYVKSTTGDEMSLHHFIIGYPHDGQVIDHINGDGLDNRRSNLRKCSKAENRRNEVKRMPEEASSTFKGVSWDAEREKWMAKISLDGTTKYLGRFDDEIKAAMAYDAAASEAWGDFARLNQQLFLTPRFTLQSLGTWGRKCSEDVWVRGVIETAEKILREVPWSPASVTPPFFWGYVRSQGLHNYANEPVKGVVVPDVRYDNEARAIRAAGGRIWHKQSDPTVRVSHEKWRSHSSESGVSRELIDQEIGWISLERLSNIVGGVLQHG